MDAVALGILEASIRGTVQRRVYGWSAHFHVVAHVELAIVPLVSHLDFSSAWLRENDSTAVIPAGELRAVRGKKRATEVGSISMAPTGVEREPAPEEGPLPDWEPELDWEPGSVVWPPDRGLLDVDEVVVLVLVVEVR